MYFNHRVLQAGMRMELAPDAVAFWRIRPTLSATWRQYARYSEGDALGGMYPERHAARFATYAVAAAAVRSRRSWLLWPAALGSIAYARRPIRRAWRRLAGRPDQRAAALVAVPAMMAFIDAAKMWGYSRGLFRRGR
jgi:hypothetical protein